MASDKSRKNLKNNILPKGEIIIYRTSDKQVHLEVKLEKETVWLTQKQISQLFDTDRSVITKHFKNIFKSRELEEESNVQKMHIPFSDKPVKLYNLDVVISIGYRVNSKRATQFRIWATQVLKNYVVQGYAINQKRLLEQQEKFKELQQAINFLNKKTSVPALKAQAEELLSIINQYANSLTLLFQYDEGKVSAYKTRKPNFRLSYEACKRLINRLQQRLAEKGEASSLFGEENNRKFEAIIGTIYQTFDKKDLYETIEEKAANLLYLTIKDHPFIDGNKRIGSLLFIYFIDGNNYLWKANGERKITDTTLVALALLIANSNPKEKDIMINIITNLLK
jgi:death-on-curing family protein